jgi:HD superfamily phosphohydrolase
MIDSDIDVDRIDYLQRDSTHCGVPYGRAFDVDRLISALWVNERKNKICLTEKGRSAFASLLMSNVIMYQEVYWHKTVRACTAMFKRFFYELLERRALDVQTARRYLECSDEEFIGKLYAKARRKRVDQHLMNMITPFRNKGRQLYKPAFVYYPEHGTYLEDGNTVEFFNKLARCKDYHSQVNMSNLLANEIRKEIPEIEGLDIILESAPVGYRESSKLEGFQFYDERRHRYEKLSTEIMTLNKYLESNQRHFIFCHSKYYEKLKTLSNERFDEILGRVCEKV